MSARHGLRQAEASEVGRFLAVIAEAEAVGQALPLQAIPEAIGQLERVRVQLTVRLICGAAAIDPLTADHLLTAQQAAELLNLSPDTLYRKARSFPFTVLLPGRQVRFSALGIERYIRAKQGRSMNFDDR